MTTQVPTTAEQIYELAKSLPEEQAQAVLWFTQFLQQQNGKQTWLEIIQASSGIWPDFPLPEDLRTRMGQDVERELL